MSLKRLIPITLILLFTTSKASVLAAGGRNQGATGDGNISTGTDFK